MLYLNVNVNPKRKIVGDCVIRAITLGLEKEGYNWDKTFLSLMAQAFEECDMPSSNAVWGKFLLKHGFEYHDIMNKCFDCYTIRDFADEHPTGTYILGTQDHAVCLDNNVLKDTFNSGNLIPQYYFEKVEKQSEDEK